MKACTVFFPTGLRVHQDYRRSLSLPLMISNPTLNGVFGWRLLWACRKLRETTQNLLWIILPGRAVRLHAFRDACPLRNYR